MSRKPTAEHERLAQATGKAEADLFTANPWYEWGPYLSERAWGTVREDYSRGGDAWTYFPHDHARSRAYRWNEDGMAGISDVHHELCLSLALWNGRDPILKERMFGLAGPQGNHGEDVKEYWWYLEGLPSHSLLKWRYHYPQQEFPYDALVNHGRGLADPELELLDTGVFDEDRYWAVDVTYAKASPTDVTMRIEVTNHGPDTETLDVLPTLWFRNTWSWEPDRQRPRLSWSGDGLLVADHPLAGYRLDPLPGPDGSPPEGLFCENETNVPRVFGGEATTQFPKDGINDHVISGAATINPEQVGSKAALRYRVTVPPGKTAEVWLRLHGPDQGPTDRTAMRRTVASGERSTPPSSTTHSRQLVPHPRRCGSSDRPAPDWCGASRCIRTTSAAGWTVIRGCRHHRRKDCTHATAAGDIWTLSMCLPCRTRGSTRGSPRGISASTRSRGHTSIRPSRSTS